MRRKAIAVWLSIETLVLTVLFYLAGYAAVSSAIEIREYSTQTDAFRDGNRFRRVPSILPPGAVQIRQVINHDDGYQWVRFKLPREQWSSLTANLVKVRGDVALSSLPVVPKLIRQGWPRALRRGSSEAADSASRYAFYSTPMPEALVAVDTVDAASSWVYMWTIPFSDR